MIAKPDDQYSDAETTQRMERALKRSLHMKPIPHKKRKPSSVGEKVAKAKGAANSGSRK